MTNPLPLATLDDKYLLREGRIYLSGIHALVRLPLVQRERDQAAGLNTAGFISGYRGSPLGTLDQQLWKAKQHLTSHHVHFEPGLNEELAATAVWGSQQAGLFAGAKYDGVFAMWYGKAPGVDRAGDALRHGNAAGASRHGGVLVLVGDDHNCKSASLPAQSEYACMHAMVPVLNPADVQDLLDFGLLGWSLSRYSGAWVGLKCLIDTMDASASIDVSEARARPVFPTDLAVPPDGLNIRWPDPPLQQERRQHDHRMAAIQAFARSNALDRTVIDPGSRRRLGIVATGKSFLDVRQALHELDLSQASARELGIGLYKVGMSWPLETSGIARFARGFETLIVVEEKRDLIEQQLARALYGLPDSERPQLLGKLDETGAPLFPSWGELTATRIALTLGGRIARWHSIARFENQLAILAERERAVSGAASAKRVPYFCPGCPHNTSTVVPEGSRALAGIGCHYMAQWMDRSTETFTQMGGEGASWIGQAPFTSTRHVFANLGDGTFAHSGSLAIRAAVAAGVNITYKLLYNDAVAMTGGQPAEGQLTVPRIATMLLAEGVAAVHVVSDEPGKYPAGALPSVVKVSGRHRLDAVQRELREIAGVTVLIYDQACAAERRRRRKRKLMPPPSRRVLINEHVCEGCGDCGVQSNCVAIVPLETPLGRKRAIDQSACNQDLSCVRGFCPSFVSVIGANAARPTRADSAIAIPEPPRPLIPELTAPFGLVIGGIGGTGVVTIGALIGMAAHIERKGISVLDMIGLAQKGGQVLTQIWLAPRPEQILATRIPSGRAKLLIGCDLAVAAGEEALSLLDRDSANAVVNSHETMAAEFTRQPDLPFPGQQLRAAITQRLDEQRTEFCAATSLATQLLGDAVAVNVLLLGYAWQKGLIPLASDSLMAAIELNGTAIELNKTAFALGRRLAHTPHVAEQPLNRTAHAQHSKRPADVWEIVERRVELLTRYQDAAYARRYENLVTRVIAQETAGKQSLSVAVAENLYRLMAYKDEYEVARLFVGTDFLAQARASFTGDIRLRFHLAPPLFAKRDATTGKPIKQEYGQWLLGVFRCLAKLRYLRGTPFDVFGYTRERRMERRLIGEYVALVEEILQALTPQNYDLAVQLARIPQKMRGFGHVKAANVAKAQHEQAELRAAFQRACVDGLTP